VKQGYSEIMRTASLASSSSKSHYPSRDALGKDGLGDGGEEDKHGKQDETPQGVVQ
jgi:hypothetical protein